MNTMRTAPRRKYGSESAVTPTLARALGRSVGGTHQLLHGEHSLVARCVRVASLAAAAGKRAWAANYFRPLFDVLRGQPRPPLTPQLVTDAQERDAAEDVAEAKALMTRSPEDLEAWLRALDREILGQTVQRDAVAGELERRRLS